MERKLSDISSKHPVLLFDGECGLCQSSVQWVIRHDKKRKFRFISLQSPVARQFLEAEEGIPADCDSLILLENGKVSVYSTAALRTLRVLGFPWSMAASGLAFPKGIRDAVYRLIARNRHRFFARSGRCMIPEKGLEALFIDGEEKET